MLEKNQKKIESIEKIKAHYSFSKHGLGGDETLAQLSGWDSINILVIMVSFTPACLVLEKKVSYSPLDI